MIPNPKRLFKYIRSDKKARSINYFNISEILKNYDFNFSDQISTPKSGFRNENFIVETSKGRKIVKKYRDNIDLSAIIHEHSILEYLENTDFPSTRIQCSKMGETLTEIGNKRYALFKYIEGGYHIFDYLLSFRQTYKHIYLAGQTLAHLHKKLFAFQPKGFNKEGFNPKTGERFKDIDYFKKRLMCCINDTDSLDHHQNHRKVSLLAENTSQIQTSLSMANHILLNEKLPLQTIHVDYGPSNLLYRIAEQPVVLDFELSRFDWRIIDIINGLEGFCKNRMRYSINKMKAFINGYLKQNGLTKRELKVISNAWEFIKLRRCINCWHSYSKHNSTKALNDAYYHFKTSKWMCLNHKKIIT